MAKLRPLEEHPRPPSLSPRREVDVTVKIAVEVHRAAKVAAIARGMPLFAFVEEALREKLGRRIVPD
jgi:predicted HicB family RNase H-like nuclease